MLDAGRALCRRPARRCRPRRWSGLIRVYYDHSLHYLSKEMWRTAMALSIEAPGTPFSQRYTRLDAMLAAQVRDLIAALQARSLAARRP